MVVIHDRVPSREKGRAGAGAEPTHVLMGVDGEVFGLRKPRQPASRHLQVKAEIEFCTAHRTPANGSGKLTHRLHGAAGAGLQLAARGGADELQHRTQPPAASCRLNCVMIAVLMWLE